MYIDTHAHLSYPDFAADLAAIVERAEAAGVNQIIGIATDLETARRTLEIAGRFGGVYAALGLHPNDAAKVSLTDVKELARLTAEPKVVAVGETGLDFYREAKTDPALRQKQKDLFWAHLELAEDRHLPVVIHNRSAAGDLLEILRAHAGGLPKEWRPWGVMHCFSGDEKLAFDCIELGLLISYTGVLTFKNAAVLREVARQVSLDHVMLETDAPYLAPVPHRGKRNEPAYIPLIAEVLAEIKGITVAEVAAATSANAHRLFRLA